MGEQMRGVYPVVETPFHENLDIDYEGLRNVVEFNIECGAAGLLTTAMSSEFYTLRSTTKLLKRSWIRTRTAYQWWLALHPAAKAMV